MNYQALGEYTAFKQQAQDAAGRRFALLYNLAQTLNRAAAGVDPLDRDGIQQALQDAEAADREMRAALDRANAAAALCGKPEIGPAAFRRD